VAAHESAGPSPEGASTALAAHHDGIAAWLSQERLQLTRVHELLLQQGLAASYTTLRMADWPLGEVAEMDFGRLGADRGCREASSRLGARARLGL
jgi:hypothetical protein